MVKKKKLGFIGAGNMAEAMIKGLRASKVLKNYEITLSDVNVERLKTVAKKYSVKTSKDNSGLIKNSDIVILAIKPQQIAEVLEAEKNNFSATHLCISILAGVTIQKIQQLIGKKIPVVRVMPNIPVLVLEGACGYCVSKEVTAGMRKTTTEILGTFCKVAENLPENEINIVTALSGSGPAYFFYFAEGMLEAAQELGIDLKLAKKLIAQTMIGTGKMLSEKAETPAELRTKVTSKGGTTESAINTMEEGAVKDVVRMAVKRAKEKADALGK
ncbi:MAG: pyrroline-5-carboxylate reductase [bacterium]